MLTQIRPDSNFCLHCQLWSNPVTCSPSQSIAEHVWGLFTQNTNPGCVCKSVSLSGTPPKPHGWAPRADHAVYTLSLSTTTKAPFQATTPSHQAVQQAVITLLTQHPALTRLWQSPHVGISLPWLAVPCLSSRGVMGSRLLPAPRAPSALLHPQRARHSARVWTRDLQGVS